MFDDQEYQQLSEVFTKCLEAIKQYRRDHGVSLSETPLDELYQPLLAEYERLAEVSAEFDVNELMRRHYLSRWKAYKHEAH